MTYTSFHHFLCDAKSPSCKSQTRLINTSTTLVFMAIEYPFSCVYIPLSAGVYHIAVFIYDNISLLNLQDINILFLVSFSFLFSILWLFHGVIFLFCLIVHSLHQKPLFIGQHLYTRKLRWFRTERCRLYLDTMDYYGLMSLSIYSEN